MSDLKQFLTKRASEEIPDTMNLRAKILQQIKADQASRRFPRLTWQWASLVVVVLALSAGAVYAWQQGGVQPDPGIQKVQNQIVQVDQTQSLAVTEPLTGLNVTIDYAYADSNRITVGYQISGSAAAGSDVQLFSNPLLTDSEGRSYLWLPTSGQQVITQGDSFTLDSIMSFDSSIVTNNPAALSLNLKIQVAYNTADLRASDPYLMADAGETTFSFSVPFIAGKTVEIAQSASAENLTIDVQRAVIAPSLTRLDVCLSSADPFAVDAWLSWETPITLDVNGQRVVDGLRAAFGGFSEPNATCRALTIPDALTDHTGTWTLTLNGFQNAESGQTVPGTWTFNFEVN